ESDDWNIVRLDLNMLKINENGSCQRIGLDGQAVEGEEPRKIEEFGAGGLDHALKSIPKEGEAHEVTAVRGKFSTVKLDKVSSDIFRV
uniref:MMS1_N domain-containing protein n=2 Tax=Bursaphelenchus xylophilus TaxID=6326 RepID=A0A1I7SPT3_BURXY